MTKARLASEMRLLLRADQGLVLKNYEIVACLDALAKLAAKTLKKKKAAFTIPGVCGIIKYVKTVQTTTKKGKGKLKRLKPKGAKTVIKRTQTVIKVEPRKRLRDAVWFSDMFLSDA